jgi:hypothetical protein
MNSEERFWIGWIAKQHVETPFHVSVTGYQDAGDGPDELLMVAVIVAIDERSAWSLIQKYHPGSRRRFITAVADGWLPTSGRIVRVGHAQRGAAGRWHIANDPAAA